MNMKGKALLAGCIALVMSSAALAETLGTGTCCGRCQETVETLVQTHARPKVWQAA